MVDQRPEFHPGIPDGCPLAGSTAATSSVFRGIRKRSPIPWDFESEAERKKFAHGTGICTDWGLSSWIDMEAVDLARSIIPGFENKCIVKFDASPEDGVIIKTPTPKQPNHHTFWKAKDKDFCNRCDVVYEKSDGVAK